MGTNAKALAKQAGIILDFTYGVIDKCILKSLSGKDSLIMTSGGWWITQLKGFKPTAKNLELR